MKKVLVTGASVGIGRQTAIAFAKRGDMVGINYKSSLADAQETLRLVEAAGGTGFLCQADVSDEKAAEALVFSACEKMGGLDVLVNNAGVTKFIPFKDLDAATGEVWDFLYRTNVESMFFCCRAASKVMKPGASIVNLASLSGMEPRGSSIPYGVTKAAIIHLTKFLAQTLAPDIRVNSVSPGTIQNTRWNTTNPSFDPEAYQSKAHKQPMARAGEPEDIAEAVYYLASDAATYITGVNLPVDGGSSVG